MMSRVSLAKPTLKAALSLSVLSVFVCGVEPSQAQMLTGYTTPVSNPASILLEPEPITSLSAVDQSTTAYTPFLSAAPSVEVFSATKSSVSAAEILQTAKPYQPSLTVNTPANTQVDSADVSAPAIEAQSTPANTGENAPVDLEADSLSYDESGEIVLAQGNVIIEQDGRILRADSVAYDVKQDVVDAKGNVVLNEANGDVHLSQSVVYSNRLQNGEVEELRSELVDGSYLTAKSGTRDQGVTTTMREATFTACEPCKDNPDAKVPWKIKAKEVVHDTQDKSIVYKNAWMTAYDVPVFYTPYFSHPDGSEDRKSGFLTPSGGFSSDLGTFIEGQYYWDIAPDQDATIGMRAMTQAAPLGLVEYRKRWDNASLFFNGSTTYSAPNEEEDGEVVTGDDQWRGHLVGEARMDINDLWRAGLDIDVVSDDQYASQYDFNDEDVLQNRLYAERFSNRNYTLAEMQLFQDTRVSSLRDDQPAILPEFTTSFIGSPGDIPFLKGRWDADFNMLNLFREGDDQDVTRLSSDIGWKRRMVSDYGLITDFDATLRGDFYYTQDVDDTTSTSSDDSEAETRVFPQLHIVSAYPMARNFESAQWSIEPLAALTLAPDIDDDDIPNEDSQDVQLDASNLFSANRFPGRDGIEDGSRATYGVRTALTGYENSSAEAFLGQSYRFDEDSNPFSEGSGLNSQSSDIVGYIKGDFDRYDLQYRFQLNNENFSPERHELDASADWNRLRLSTSYLYAQAVEDSDIEENREQVSASAQYYFNKEWRMNMSTQYDLGVDPGLRTSTLGLQYYGQCVSWTLQAEKNLTNGLSGDSDTEILFRLGLKNISDFVRSGLRDEQ